MALDENQFPKLIRNLYELVGDLENMFQPTKR